MRSPKTPSAALPLALLIALLSLLSQPNTAPGQPGLEPVRAKHGMVATSDEYASQVGRDILMRGGNAVDAAVAVALALAVTHPSAGNLGGGGFMLIHMADGRCAAIDYRETAPAAASRDMYLDSKGRLIPKASLEGSRASGVPGTVAGLAMALDKFGTRKWADLVEPARKLAEEGFSVSHGLARSLRSAKRLTRFPESTQIFLNGGKPFEASDRFRQPDLALTLKRLAEKGPREFYEGRTARLIADDMQARAGLITLDDLKSYRPILREPLRGTYRGCDILTMPPPSSGGIALIEMLNTLEHFDLAAAGHNSSAKYHLLVEAMRRAFADRAEFLGDPDFVQIPVSSLISRRYADQLAKSIDPAHATPSDRVRHGDPVQHESRQTTHFSVVDAAGNAVANTYTLNTGYGCGATVRGAGFLMNNEMDDFTSKPGAPNTYGLIQSEKNAIAPRKRPLSSMTPTILLRNGKLFMVTGSPGGPTIINTVMQTIINVVDHRMNIRQAVEAPRIHHQWRPDEIDYEPFGLAQDVIDALKAKGHVFAAKPDEIGDAQAIMIDPATGERLGASDPRSENGKAIGY